MPNDNGRNTYNPFNDPVTVYLAQQVKNLASWFLARRETGIMPQEISAYPAPFGRKDETGTPRLPKLQYYMSEQHGVMRRATRAATTKALKMQFKPLLGDTKESVKRFKRIAKQIDRIERTESYKYVWLAIEKAHRTGKPPALPQEEVDSFYRLNQMVVLAYKTLYEGVALMRSMSMDMESANLTSLVHGEGTQNTLARLQSSSTQLRRMTETLGDFYS
jgi:hypothetical protein